MVILVEIASALMIVVTAGFLGAVALSIYREAKGKDKKDE